MAEVLQDLRQKPSMSGLCATYEDVTNGARPVPGRRLQGNSSLQWPRQRNSAARAHFLTNGLNAACMRHDVDCDGAGQSSLAYGATLKREDRKSEHIP